MPDLSTEADRSTLRVLDFFRIRDRAAFGWLSEQWQQIIHDDPQMSRVRVTVEMVLGQDTVLRLSTDSLEVVSALTGETIAYLPQLQEEPEISRSYDLGDPGAEVEGVTVQFSAALVEPSRIISAGRLLAGFGEVCLQVPGGTYEERLVLLRGEITGGVTFGSDAEVMEVEISDPKITADLVVPPWVSSTDRHADIPEDWVGERYPLVFNAYQKIEAIRVTSDTGWPSGTSPSWLACYGHDSSITAVYVNGVEKASGSADYPWAEVDAVDLQGTPYKEIAFSHVATTWDDSDSVHVSVTSDENIHLIEIVRKLVQEFSVLGVRGSHQPLFAKARGMLPDLRPNVVINASNAADEAGILSFIEGTLLESYPMVSMVWQNGRYGPIVTDYRTRKPVAELEAGVYPLIQRVSDYQEIEKEEIFNSFTLRYAWDALAETFTGVATRDPSNDLTCRLSRDLAGPRTYDALESYFIQTSSEANYVIDWLVAHLARPSYYVEWQVHPWVLLFLTRGDSVWYTDPDVGWDSERAVVQSIARDSGGEVTLGLRIWPGTRRLYAAGR